jgi:hypothetical protein
MLSKNSEFGSVVCKYVVVMMLGMAAEPASWKPQALTHAHDSDKTTALQAALFLAIVNIIA